MVRAEYDPDTSTPFYFDFHVWFKVGPGAQRASSEAAPVEYEAYKADLVISLELKDVWEIVKVANTRGAPD